MGLRILHRSSNIWPAGSLASRVPALSESVMIEELDLNQNRHNHRRPHGAISGAVPDSRL